MTGRPACRAVARAETLSPKSSNCSGRGPMKTMPFSAQARAKSAFSLRKPYPGWMASTSTRFARATMPSMSR